VGSLALAAYGAVGGAGQGLQTVGKAEMATQMEQKKSDMEQERQEALERLKAAEEEKIQAANIAAQQNLQQSGQTFTKAQTEAGYEHAGRAATAAQAAKMEQIQEENKGRLGAAGILGKARVDVANINATKPTGRQLVSEYKPAQAVLNSPGIDRFSKQPLPGRKVDVLQHWDGTRWIQGTDGNLYPFDPSKPDGYGGGAAPRGRAPAADTQALIRNPLGVLPSGTSTRDYFVNKFGYLPREYLGAANAARNHVNASYAQPAPAAQGGSAGAAAPPTASNDQSEDAEDAHVVSDPYGATGNPTSQPSDDEPAQ
jgi:hypothetical protein